MAVRISADSAHRDPSSGPSVLSLVPNTLVTLHPTLTPPSLRASSPALGANKRLFPFNGLGPAPALPPAPTAHRRVICQSLPQPEPANPLHPGLGQPSVHLRFGDRKGAPGALASRPTLGCESLHQRPAGAGMGAATLRAQG